MEGRQLAGMDPEFTALIPDMLDESSLGKIPKGWHVQSVGEVCEFAYGRALKNEDRHVGEVPVFGSNGRIGWNDSALVTGPGIVVGRKGNPGIVTWSSADFWPIDTTFYIVPRGPIRGMHYLFHALKYLDLPGLGADSAVPGLNRNMAYMSKMLVPPPPIVSAFERCVSSLVVQERENELQSATLTTVRDRLLPKLLCGAICLTESNQASTVP
jgi:type I restriction enzyme S subunit